MKTTKKQYWGKMETVTYIRQKSQLEFSYQIKHIKQIYICHFLHS